jgi:MscS family membrane protein
MRTTLSRARAAAYALLAAALPLAALAEDRAALPNLPVPADARPFFEAHLPRALLQSGPHGLLWWQWLALPVMVALAVVVGWLLGLLSRAILGRVAARTRNTWDDEIIVRAAGPIAALWAVAFVTVVHPWLLLGSGAEAVLERLLRAAAYLILFWGGLRLVDVGFGVLRAAPWSRGASGLVGLLPLGRKIAQIVLLSMGAVAVLNELGFQVASLLAGLGIGGIALALAAQKTVENLFGSVAIGVDRPFRVGDFVKVEEFVGTVESIGMRSTRFRTLDRTIITIPNGKLADMRSETFAVRDRIRLFTNLALGYQTTAAQMRAVLAGIEEALRGHPLIAADAPSVRFTELREWSLNVEVMAWFATADWGQFTSLRQELYLRFLEIVQAAGAEFAFPVRTVRLSPTKNEGPAARAPRTGGAERDRTDDL